MTVSDPRQAEIHKIETMIASLREALKGRKLEQVVKPFISFAVARSSMFQGSRVAPTASGTYLISSSGSTVFE